MLKIIHCADVHLGSKIEAKLPKHKAEERRGEVRATFHRMVEYAKQNGVRAIVIAGDAFDSDRPTRRDKELFYAVIRENPEVDFLYLRGNHDLEASYEERPANLKTFADEWTAYEYGDVTICGIEMRRENATSLYSTLKLDKAKKNIVVLHGQIANSAGADKINLAKLGGKYIDYLALGHIHSYEEKSLDDRGRYAYSGCLEGRGFDEIGEKGFVLLEIDDAIVSQFVPFAHRVIEEYSVNIENAENAYTAYLEVKKRVPLHRENLYRIHLVGEVCFDDDGMGAEVEKLLSHDCYFVSVKDKTLQKIDEKKYDGDVSLRGEFVRLVLNHEEWSDEKKRKIISLGLKTLEGREVE